MKELVRAELGRRQMNLELFVPKLANKDTVTSFIIGYLALAALLLWLLLRHTLGGMLAFPVLEVSVNWNYINLLWYLDNNILPTVLTTFSPKTSVGTPHGKQVKNLFNMENAALRRVDRTGEGFKANTGYWPEKQKC